MSSFRKVVDDNTFPSDNVGFYGLLNSPEEDVAS
jgi:hypothetical protein